MVALVVETEETDCNWDEPILDTAGRCIGFVTSGGFGHWTGKSIAIGYVETGSAAQGTAVQVEILGTLHKAVVQGKALHDPTGMHVRG